MREFKFDSEKHIFTVGGERWPSITQVLVDAGFINTRWFDEYSATRGTYVHKIVEWDIAGTLDENSVDDELRGYYDAWKNFLVDTVYTVTETEKPRINEIHRFAGIADSFGMLGPKSAVIDIKTGSGHPAIALQTAAQTLLADHPIFYRYSLHLKKNGTYKLIPYAVQDLSRDRDIFLAALTCWWWKEKHGLLTKEEKTDGTETS